MANLIQAVGVAVAVTVATASTASGPSVNMMLDVGVGVGESACGEVSSLVEEVRCHTDVHARKWDESIHAVVRSCISIIHIVIIIIISVITITTASAIYAQFAVRVLKQNPTLTVVWCCVAIIAVVFFHT